MGQWVRAADNSGNLIGVNDSSIYTFKSRKYESLAREILQNSLDECYSDNEPVRVEFHSFEIMTEEIPGIDKFREFFQDGLEYWKDDQQDNGREFFEEGLRVLEQETVEILRISDFNTKGVLGSKQRIVRSSADITPWYNLLKSEGSSSKGQTQGGSFGIGKNAAFANSLLRTVFYSTYDIEGIKGYEGVAKLATIYKNGKQHSAKVFYGNEINGNSCAIDGMLDLDHNFERTQCGTDIYIIGFDSEQDWKLRMITSILSDFIIPISANRLEVDLDGERINAGNISSFYEFYIPYCNERNMKTMRDELTNSYNYYQILTSEETKVFKKDFAGKGTAVLKVLYNPEFERKIMRTRKTGMKLFEKGGISSSIGFSGIVSLEGEELNKLFRKMENPAHTSWSPDNINNPMEKREAKKILKELNSWMRDEVINNAADQDVEQIDVIGLSDYLPAELIGQEQDNGHAQETVSNNINEITIYKPDREEFKKDKQTIINDPIVGGTYDAGQPGVSPQPGGGSNDQKGGRGTDTDDNIGSGDKDVFIKVKKSMYRARLMKQKEDYLLLIRSKQDIEQAMIKLFISGETSVNNSRIVFAKSAGDPLEYEIRYNAIWLGQVNSNETVGIQFGLEDGNDYSLEVELYEHQQQ